MRNRFRVVAALLALFAFSLTFAETAWAACGPEHSARDSSAVQHVHESSPAQHDTESEPTRPDGPGMPGCPLPGSAVAACGMLSLPGAAVKLDVTLTVRAEAGLAAEQAGGRLVASSLFRPPQQ